MKKVGPSQLFKASWYYSSTQGQNLEVEIYQMLLGAFFARLVWFIMNYDVTEGDVCIYIVEMWKLI